LANYIDKFVFEEIVKEFLCVSLAVSIGIQSSLAMREDISTSGSLIAIA